MTGVQTCALPISTPYQMQDAFDKLRLAEDESLYWEITEYHHFEELSSFLNGACDLNDLNALAQRLSELDERQCTAFAGLLKMEQKKGEEIPISRQEWCPFQGELLSLFITKSH